MKFGEWKRRLERIWCRDEEAHELAEEMRLHVELRARKLGSGEEAHYAALRQFGNRGSVADASAAVWGWSSWEKFTQDVRHALRSLRKTPGFTCVAVATLAVGLGMNTAVFSVVNAVMLRALPYPQSDRLVSLWEEQIYDRHGEGFSSHGSSLGKAGGPKRTTVSVANIADYAASPAFAAMASFDSHPANLTGTGDPERIGGEAVSAGFFELLGARPALGRTFSAEDDRPGARHVTILTYDFWQRRLGGDTGVLSRDVMLDGAPYRVIGVMPRGFRSPFHIVFPQDSGKLFVPAAYPKSQLAQRGDHDVNVVARLRPGVGVAQAQAALNAISSGLQKQFPQSNGNFRAVLAPLADDLVRAVSGPLWILLGASALMVLITCVNVANLMLVRAVRRQHESSVRMALGAGRWGLVRQFLTESLVLAAAGCAAGMAVGFGLMRALVALAPTDTPRLAEVSLDWRVFGLSAAVATLTGLVFGIIPAWQASRAQAAEALRTSARSAGSKSQARWRATLTTAEVGLSLVLLIGAGLLLRSFLAAMGVELGFQTEGVLAMNVNLPQARYQTAESRYAFFRRLEERVQALPGVRAVAFANRMPLRGGWGTGIFVDTAPDQERVPDAQAVGTGYFETLGISLLRGRVFTLADREGSGPVAVVNQEFARQYLDGRDPLGHQLQRGQTWCRIVGVVNDIRRAGKLERIKPEIYLAAAQTALYPVRLADLAVRTAGDPRRLVIAIQQQVWALDRDLPVTNVRTMREIISESAAQSRFDMLLLAVFAAVAVLLASIGIFGVLSYLVSQRIGELGIRAALGASPRRILALVLRQAGAWIAGGVALGLLGAFALTRYLETLLFQVKRNDPWTYLAAAALLTVVAATAALVPARRGSRADPVKALRYE
ncbi:MAG TPA: ABC transporter permease [Bryobacteraceae bacterium]|nr:ABC transporter permease [Bryobacteraceae bacterium]